MSQSPGEALAWSCHPKTAELSDPHCFTPPSNKAVFPATTPHPLTPPCFSSLSTAGRSLCSYNTNGFGNESKRLSGMKKFPSRYPVPQPGLFHVCCVPMYLQNYEPLSSSKVKNKPQLFPIAVKSHRVPENTSPNFV